MAHFDSTRGFGVEIEIRPFQIRQDGQRYRITPAQVGRWVRDAGLNVRVERYNHETRPHWKITTDVSCGDGFSHGIELVSPILYGEDGLNQVRTAIRKLRAHGAVVDERCGLHVHHDARTLDGRHIKNLMLLYARFQPAFNELVAPHRNRNGYCVRLDLENVKTSAGAVGDAVNAYMVASRMAVSGRYGALNLDAYARHRSVEFRQFHGTLDAEQAASWVVVTQMLVTRAIQPWVNDKKLTDKMAANPVNALRQFVFHWGVGELERNAFRYLAKTRNGRGLQPRNMATA